MNNSEQLEKIEQIKEFLKQKDIKNIYLVFTDTNGKILYKSVGVEEKKNTRSKSAKLKIKKKK